MAMQDALKAVKHFKLNIMKTKTIDYHWQLAYQEYHIECSPKQQMEKLRIRYTNFEIHGHGEFTRFFNCTNLPKFKRLPKYLEIK